jgi:hypothetical protein
VVLLERHLDGLNHLLRLVGRGTLHREVGDDLELPLPHRGRAGRRVDRRGAAAATTAPAVVAAAAAGTTASGNGERERDGRDHQGAA